jgi:hypothetical protein
MTRSCYMFRNDAQSWHFSLIPKFFPFFDCFACDATYGMTINVWFRTPNIINWTSNITSFDVETYRILLYLIVQSCVQGRIIMKPIGHLYFRDDNGLSMQLLWLLMINYYWWGFMVTHWKYFNQFITNILSPFSNPHSFQPHLSFSFSFFTFLNQQTNLTFHS